MNEEDPRFALARRLRELREAGLAGKKITQPELARVLGRGKPVSVPLISSYESRTKSQIIPPARLDDYAALFATPRSFEGEHLRILGRADLTEDELRAMTSLRNELIALRNKAVGATSPAQTKGDTSVADLSLVEEAPWRFRDGNTITIVCAPWPPRMLKQIPYTNINDPDYIELLTYSELDALWELHGHIRATNPANQVHRRLASAMSADDYSSHVVSLGGVDWNTATSNALRRLQLPVQQIADWKIEDGQYFEVNDGGKIAKHRPRLRKATEEEKKENPDVADKGILLEDVALFARAASPFNKRRTMTICNGMYGRGTLGAVRALTDARFRDRNAEYLRNKFGSSSTYCLLTRVPIVDGLTLTPDWTTGDYTLFEWCE